MLTNYSGLETILEQRCSSSHFFLYTQKDGGVYRRFIDVDSSGTMTDVGANLTGKLEWGETPDPTVVGNYRGYTNKLTFKIRDDGTTVSQWTKRQTGILLAVGANSSSTYAQQTRCFHGIVWDWTLVDGENNTYQVTCHDLSKLWKDYKVGSEALDSPNAFGIIEDTITTDPRKKFYAIPSPTEPKFVYKARYEGADINRNNIAVAKFFNGESGEINLLSLMLPLETNLTCIAQYFEGKNYSDVIDHFESNLTIAANMPSGYQGHTGDTLTATNGPWAHFGENESAWKQLGDAVGTKFYSFYYNENGQITLVKPDEAKAASGVTRGTSETDQSKAGQIVKFEYVDNEDILNNPAVKTTKYGTDSATGHELPAMTTTNYYMSEKHLFIPNSDLHLFNSLATPPLFIPGINPGNVNIQEFVDALTISSGPTSIDDYWQANTSDSGSVTIDGSSDYALLECPDTAGVAFIGRKIPETYKTWRATARINLATGCEFVGEIGTGSGLITGWKLRALFKSDGTCGFEVNYQGTSAMRHALTSVDAIEGVDYLLSTVDVLGATGSLTDFSAWSPSDDYFITLEREIVRGSEGTDAYFIKASICDSNYRPLSRVQSLDLRDDLNFAATIDQSYFGSGTNYIKFGSTDGTTFLNEAKVRLIAYNAPNRCMTHVSMIDREKDNIGRFFTSKQRVMYGNGSRQFYSEPDTTTVSVIGANIEGSYDKNGGHIATDSAPGATYFYVRTAGAPFQPEVNSIFTASSTQTGIDGSTTVASSQSSNGYKGLNEGTWEQRWLWSDQSGRDLANTMAKFNLEQRDVAKLTTKFNPKYKPHDIIAVTYFSKLTGQKFELVGIKHSVNLDLSGGGAKTILTLRKWTA